MLNVEATADKQLSKLWEIKANVAVYLVQIPRNRALFEATVCSILSCNHYRLVSNIRRASNISCTPTLGNSQLEFSPIISLTKTSNTRCTPSFDSWVSFVDKVWSRIHMVRAALTSLRFWLTMDHRTNKYSLLMHCASKLKAPWKFLKASWNEWFCDERLKASVAETEFDLFFA